MTEGVTSNAIVRTFVVRSLGSPVLVTSVAPRALRPPLDHRIAAVHVGPLGDQRLDSVVRQVAPAGSSGGFHAASVVPEQGAVTEIRSLSNVFLLQRRCVLTRTLCDTALAFNCKRKEKWNILEIQFN